MSRESIIEISVVSEFVDAARAFIRLVDGLEAVPKQERTEGAARALAQLYAAGVSLPAVEPTDIDLAGVDVADLRSSSGFEANYYYEVFDPYLESTPVIGDLVDDLLDTYGDVKRGLVAYDAGNIADAVWDWRFHFENHWGDHAVDALRALHRLLARQRRGEATIVR